MRAKMLGVIVVAGLTACAMGAQSNPPGAGAEPPADAPATARPAQPASDPNADLLAWAEQAKREVERITGEKFETDVLVKVVSVEDLSIVLARPIQADMAAAGIKRNDGTPMSELEIRVRSMGIALRVAARTFGLYSHDEKVVYVVPSSAAAYAKKYGWSERTAERVPRLAMAHELVHALQDQRAGLSKRLLKSSGEARVCLTCVSEGHAVWATDQLAAAQGWGAANGVLWGVVTGVQSDDEGQPKGLAKQPKMPPLRLAPESEIYAKGKAFMAHHAAFAGEGLKGHERLWAILRRPPGSMAEIAKPETFEIKAEPTDVPNPAPKP